MDSHRRPLKPPIGSLARDLDALLKALTFGNIHGSLRRRLHLSEEEVNRLLKRIASRQLEGLENRVRDSLLRLVSGDVSTREKPPEA